MIVIHCDKCGDDLISSQDVEAIQNFMANEIEINDRKSYSTVEKYHLCDSCLDDLRDELSHWRDQ